jgi:hypothetical protein
VITWATDLRSVNHRMPHTTIGRWNHALLGGSRRALVDWPERTALHFRSRELQE